MAEDGKEIPKIIDDDEVVGNLVKKIDHYLAEERVGQNTDEEYFQFVSEVLGFLESKGIILNEEDEDTPVEDILKKARAIAVKDDDGEVADKETEEELEKEKKLVWYDGIVDDLLTITNPRLHLKDIRTPVKEKMMKLGIDVQGYIARHKDDIDKSMMLLRGAAYAYSDDFDEHLNPWGEDRDGAYSYLRENLGIGREEDREGAKEDIDNNERIDKILFVLKDQIPEELITRLAEEAKTMSDAELSVFHAAVAMIKNIELRDKHQSFWNNQASKILGTLGVSVV